MTTTAAERILYSTDVREGSQLRVTAHVYRGTTYVSVRLYWKPDGGDWQPTKRGVTFSEELLPDIIAALQRADAEEPPTPKRRSAPTSVEPWPGAAG